MRFTIFSLTISILVIVFSCKSTPDYTLKNDKCKEILVPERINNYLQIDSIFANIRVIPLETNNNCLIGQIAKAQFYDEKIFLLDSFRKLLVFDAKGKFLYNVGKVGRGPGEYPEIRDFDLDTNGNIYILTFQRIQVYSNSGRYLRNILFNFVTSDSKIFCNPLEFSVKSDGNFYLWGGSFGIKDNSNKQNFAMYEMTEKGKIVNKYFPLKYNTTQGFERHRFTRYNDSFLIEPNFGIDTIYSLGKEGLIGRYKIDFGNKTFKSTVPEGFTSLVEFKLKADYLYYHSVEGFIETSDWIYFRFTHQKKVYNVYYSKVLSKTFVSCIYPVVNCRLAPRWITSQNEGDFIGFSNSHIVIETQNECKGKKVLQNIINPKVTDNPIMFICSLKKY